MRRSELCRKQLKGYENKRLINLQLIVGESTLINGVFQILLLETPLFGFDSGASNLPVY
jgi:hypothetical protein